MKWEFSEKDQRAINEVINTGKWDKCSTEILESTDLDMICPSCAFNNKPNVEEKYFLDDIHIALMVVDRYLGNR